MFNSIANILGYLMNFIYNIVQNYGLAIIIFTIFIKIILLPLTIKQQKAMKRTQELQPLVQELQRKYGNDQKKFTEEYQKLLKEKNMNMMSGMGCSGCIIQLIQIPILFGMLYMMASPLSNILKMSDTQINEYKAQAQEIRVNEEISVINQNKDLYSEDEYNELITKAKETEYFTGRYSEIEIMKHVDIINMDFLGLNLCDITLYNKSNWTLWIIPILSGIFTYLTSKLAEAMNPQKNNKDNIKSNNNEKSMVSVQDELPMPNMKALQITMPIMTAYIACAVPQGVGLYWVIGNIIGVIQQLALKNNLPNTKKDV